MGIDAHHMKCWDEAAATYCSRQDQAALIYEPVLDGLLGDVSRKHVLDAGCGGGRYARKLASLGATVTGVDGSSEMIAIARRSPAQPSLRYEVADLTEKLPFLDASYDVVLANMVLMDLPRIDVAMAGFARILRNVGILVFSIAHPCFFCSDWVSDALGGKAHKAVADYLTPKTVELDFWGMTFHFHRPLSHYFDALTRNGFCIDAFREPVPSGKALEEHPDWEHHRRVPSFVVARAVVR